MWNESRAEGIALAEVTVALAIVAALAVSALTLVGTQLRVAAIAAETLEAAVLAEYLIGRLELSSTEDLQPFGSRTGRFGPPLERYRYTVDIEPIAAESGLLQIGILVLGPRGTFALQTRMRVGPGAQLQPSIRSAP